MPETAKEAADYIVPLNVNGLHGRMLRAPARAKKYRRREILLVYGHHAMLERWWSLVQNLERYGNVTMPDMPGFGGMESFAKIGTKPTIDAHADYLASFIKLRYRRKRLTIFAVSYGFIVVTRMLQRYPELSGKVDMLISAVGFMHADDLVFKAFKRRLFSIIARLFATRPLAFFIRYCFLNKLALTFLYKKLPSSKRRMVEVTPEQFKASMDFEVKIWHSNDVRTHWLTTGEFLRFDNTTTHIPLPVMHVISKNDYYVNNVSVEQHMRQVFSGYEQFESQAKAHVPNVLADKAAMSVMLPPALRRRLIYRKK